MASTARFPLPSWTFALLTAAALWVSALAWAPAAAAAPPGSLRFHAATLIYLAGGGVCHQQASRSFHRGGTQVPVCARCTGLYAGALAGLAWAATRRRRRPTTTARIWLAVAVLPTAASVAAASLGWMDGSNIIRAALAIPAGAVVAWLVAAAADNGLG